jgi:hypothetical protein
MKPKCLSLFPNLPHRKSTFIFNPGEQILVLIKTICSLQDIFGNAGTPSAHRPIRARIAQSGPGSPNQGPYRPIRARSPANERQAWRTSVSFEYQGGGGGDCLGKTSSKCASCHSNEMLQRIIHTHVKVSSKAYVYDDTIYNFCARARFAGCSYLRHIILGLNTVYPEMYTTLAVPLQCS